MNAKIEHLKMIEGIIERMARNSFQLKGWTLMLVVALIGLASAENINQEVAWCAFVPPTVFWILDSFYLRVERKYRALYKTVAAKSENDIDFDLDSGKAVLTIKESKKLCPLNCFISVSESLYYLPLIICIGFIIWRLF